MGCSPLKFQRNDRHKARLSSLKVRSLSIMSRNSTVNLVETTTKDLHNISIKCLKLRIFSPNPAFALKALNMEKTQLSSESLKFVPILNLIKKLYSDYSTAFSRFCSEVHEQCIPSFNIKKGLEILMISLMNNTNANIITFKSKPFIEVFEPLNPKTIRILEAWKMLAEALEQVISINKSDIRNQIILIKEFSEKVREYANFVLKPIKYIKACKVLDSCVKTFESMNIEAVKTMNELKKFFDCIKLKNIQKQIQTFKVSTFFSGKKIVHGMYGL